jgi:hypothetical protein
MASYKVIDFKQNSGQLIIEFAEGMAPLAIDIPIRDGLFITGEELNTYIQGFIPTWHIERVAQLNAGVANASELQSLVVETAAVEIPNMTEELEQLRANAEAVAETNFQQRVAKALINLGVLDSDPTASS